MFPLQTVDAPRAPIDGAVFLANVDRVMTEKGLRNACVARTVNVSRQMVSLWRRGVSVPSVSHQMAIADALGCDWETLNQASRQEKSPMMLLTLWARREDIPLTRARTLFASGVLTGQVGHLVPVEQRAPRESKRIVSFVRRRLLFNFAVRLNRRLCRLEMSDAELAKRLNVPARKVMEWRSGRDRISMAAHLADIADILSCDMSDLVMNPFGR